MSDFQPTTSGFNADTPLPSTELNGNTSTSAGSSLQNAKDSVLSNASAAVNAVQNHPITQSVTNGPVAENILDQHAKTSSEFSNLAAARTRPSQPTATGQQLTHYHSFFYSLLSWENPRASGIAYLSTIVFIFAARYLDILRYFFKLTWMTLGITVIAEVAGKTLFSHGFASQVRPRKYYTLPKETLDAALGDVHELINFFVIESQRIVFAENVPATIATFLGAFLSYYLIKIVPFWGLALLADTVLFLSPLIYKTNKELIDHHLAKASNIASEQANQVKSLAGQHAARVTSTTKQYAGDYSAKAQEMIGSVRNRSVSPTATKSSPSATTAQPKESFSSANTAAPSSTYAEKDFPTAPKEEFKTTPIADEFKSTTAAPSVGSSINELRDENEPLIST